MNSALSGEYILQQYEQNGYYIRESLLTEHECRSLKEEALRILNEKAKPGATVFVGVSAESPLYYRLASDRRITSILKHLMPAGIMFLSDKFVFKSGTNQLATPWHIDAFYWRGTRPKISVWIPLDDATEQNGTLKVVPGTHKQNWTAERKNNDTYKKTGEFPSSIDKPSWMPEQELICNIPKGSAVFFSDQLVHGSCSNNEGLDRYAIISTYHAPGEDEVFDLNFKSRHVIQL